MTTKDFPSVPKDLIEALEAKFPDHLPVAQDTSIEMFRLLQGQQYVVKFLRHMHQRQNKNILEDT